MHSVTLASKTFHLNDQVLFASLTGDFNPIHMNPVAARRMQAGTVVVHGIHAVLWALDKLAELGILTEQISSLRVQFTNFIPVGAQLELRLLNRDGRSVRAELAIGALRTATLVASYGRPGTVPEAANNEAEMNVAGAPRCFNQLTEMANLRGSMDVVAPADRIESHFPHVSTAIGGSQVAALGALSALVGMICPGLHSLFGGFAVELADSAANQNIQFKVAEIDERFRMLRMSVSGAGISGSVQAILRWPPVPQPSLDAIMKVVSPGEFAGSTALIIGGSRGLGALTAKIIAAGGGAVILTYATGQADAQEVTDEIERQIANSVCRACRYDVHEEPAAQLGQMTADVSHLYYFASGRIARQKDSLFVANLFDEFAQVYVKGFYDCCRYLGESVSQPPLTVFYPSTVFVESNPPDMAEYSMAKMAGEMLCAQMNRAGGPVRVIATRLPPLLTDQTATVLPMERGDSLKVMLPIIRNVQISRFAGGALT